jgi:hypothetical protein
LADVLLACVAADRSRLDAIAKALLDEGHRVGWQHEAIWVLPPGTCVVATWSRYSRGVRWLENLARASARRGKLVSIRLDDGEAPRGVQRHRVIDLSMWPARDADRSVDSLLTVAAAIGSATAIERQPRRNGSLGVAIALIAAGLLAIAWWRGGAVPVATTHPGNHSGDVAAGERPADTEVLPGDPGMSAVAPVQSDAAPPAAIGTTRAQPAGGAEFLGGLALEQVLTAMTGDAELMASARSNAERALTLDPAQPAARLALGVLLMAMDLDWQQGRQLITASAAGGDSRLLPLAERFLRIYGVGKALPAAAGACADVELRFIELEPVQRLARLNDACFVAAVHDDAKLRGRLGIDHE